MRIVRIDDVEGLERARPDWQAVWAADPHTTVFGSWGWMRGWVEAASREWCVLAAVDEEGVPVAFLPLALSSHTTAFGLKRDGSIQLAGTPMADHTGLLCRPEWSDEALPPLAEAAEALMEESEATRFRMDSVADPRWDRFLECFGRDRFMLDRGDPISCPCILLPEHWEEYMDGSRKRRSLLRKAEREGFVVGRADEGDLDRYIEVFLDLHQMRHGAKEPSYLKMMTALLRWTHREGTLRLLVLWHDDRPAGAHVGFVDRHRRVLHAYNGGWDDWFKKYSPPRVIELYSIRRAIEEGIQTYDLGRGGEGYKFGYGAVETLNANFVLARRTPYHAARALVRRLPRLLISGGEEARDGASAPPVEAAARRPIRSEGDD